MAMGTCWQSGSWTTNSWADGTWEEQGAGDSMPAGDLTTVFTKWYAEKGWPLNEKIRASLNGTYGTSYEDIQPLVARFLRDRS